jgi:hypothetical protein
MTSTLSGEQDPAEDITPNFDVFLLGKNLSSFPKMRYSLFNTFGSSTGKAYGIKADSATALWVLQLAHQAKKQMDPSGKWVTFMDNFYTRHRLGQALKAMTDGEVKYCVKRIHIL